MHCRGNKSDARHIYIIFVIYARYYCNKKSVTILYCRGNKSDTRHIYSIFVIYALYYCNRKGKK